jgi:hypothetical protein
LGDLSKKERRGKMKKMEKMEKKKYVKPEVIIIPVDFKQLVKNTSGGGCPFVFVWNGREYLKENNILPLCEDLLRNEEVNEEVVEDFYVLQNEPCLESGFIRLKIEEFEREISWINNFKLFAVEHPGDTYVGVDQKNGLQVFGSPRSVLGCRDQDGGDRLLEVSNSDWYNPAAYFQAERGDSLTIEFPRISNRQAERCLLVVVDPSHSLVCGCVEKEGSIHIKIGTKTVAVLHGRENFYPEVADLTEWLEILRKQDRISLRLEFTAHHSISFIGLDVSEPILFQKKECVLTQASHSLLRDVTTILRQDNTSVRLYPGESIELKFSPPELPKTGNKVSYILYSKGFYIPTTKIFSLAKAREAVFA